MIKLIFKFLIEITIWFLKFWKFRIFLYWFLRIFFSFKIFERLFFKLCKKKMKKQFFHFSHVITKCFIHNVSKFHKKRKIIRKFFSFHNVQFRCLISLRHFFLWFMKRNIFFYCFSKSNWFFNIFIVFLKLVVALDFYYIVIA